MAVKQTDEIVLATLGQGARESESEEASIKVVPYLRLVPNGVDERGNLKASLLLTPQPVGDDHTTSLTLHEWPSRVIDLLGDNHQWSFDISVKLGVYERLPSGGYAPPNPNSAVSVPNVVASADRLKKAHKDKPKYRSRLNKLWQDTLLGGTDEKDHPKAWTALKDALAASAQGSKITSGNIKAPEGDEARKTDNGGVPLDYPVGKDGSVQAANAGAPNTKIDAITCVPHADLSLAIEFERVRDLIGSLADKGVSNEDAKERKEEADKARQTALDKSKKVKPDDAKWKDAESFDPDTPLENESYRNEQIRFIKIAERKALSASLVKNRNSGRTAYIEAIKNNPTGKDECGAVDFCAQWSSREVSSLAQPESQDRTEKLTLAANAHAYSSWQTESAPPKENSAPIPEGKTAEEQIIARDITQRFFTIQSTPSLARLMCFAIDVVIPAAAIRKAIAEQPAKSGKVLEQRIDGASYHYLFVSPAAPNTNRWLDIALKTATPWTLAKAIIPLEDKKNPIYFWPASKEEMEIPPRGGCNHANVTQYNGYQVMACGWNETDLSKRKPRYDLSSIDLRSATEMEYQKQRNLSANLLRTDAKSSDGSALSVTNDADKDQSVEDLTYASTLQTAGLVLLDRGLQDQKARQLAARMVKLNENQSNKPIVLDAEDLTIGFRLQMSIPTEGQTEYWRPLMSRRTILDQGLSGSQESQFREMLVEVVPDLIGSSGEAERSDLDAAFLSVGDRIAPSGTGGQDDDTTRVEMFVEEAIGQWDGTPMGADCVSAVPNENGVTATPEDILPFNRTIRLPDSNVVPEHRPARLIYGWPYRMALSAVYSGGVSMTREDHNRASGRLKSMTAYPPASAQTTYYFRFLRQHRLDAPFLAIAKGHALKMHGHKKMMGYETSGEMVIRSATNDATLDTKRRAAPEIAQRLLFAPAMPLVELARHGTVPLDKNEIGKRPPGALLNIAWDSNEGGFPITVTRTKKGLNDGRYPLERYIAPASATRQTRLDLSYGDAVVDKADEEERQQGVANLDHQYYPDADASKMVLRLRHPGSTEYVGKSVEADITGDAYNETTPVLLSVVKRNPASPTTDGPVFGQTRTKRATVDVRGLDGDIRRGDGLEVFDVELALAAGESYDVDAWCVPSAQALVRKFSIVQSLCLALASNQKDCGNNPEAACLNGLSSLEKFNEAFRKDVAERYRKSTRSKTPDGLVGPGGIPCPSPAMMYAVAECLHEELLKRPLNEICCVQTIKTVHAINAPTVKPILQKSAIARVKDLQTHLARTDKVDTPWEAGVTDFQLLGEVHMDFTQADGFEIIAKCVSPASSVFDDPERKRSLLRKREGTFPTIEPRSDLAGQQVLLEKNNQGYRKALDIFGFEVDNSNRATVPSSTVTLMKVENLPRASKDYKPSDFPGMQSLDLSLMAAGNEKPIIDANTKKKRGVIDSDTGEESKHHVLRLHSFDDSKQRNIELAVRAISRSAQNMTSSNRLGERGQLLPGEPLENDQQAITGDPVNVVMGATVRPAKPDSMTPYPVFEERQMQASAHITKLTRQMVTRVPLGRGWYSSGENEKLGLVVWPPNLPEQRSLRDDVIEKFRSSPDHLEERELELPVFRDEDLGRGGAFITRYGADPLRKGQNEESYFAPITHFRDIDAEGMSKPGSLHDPTFHPNMLMPINDDTDRASEGAVQEFMTVGIIAYTPLFDAEKEQWYVDVPLHPGASVEPMVRLGLVRFQPHAADKLKVSHPTTEWIQLLPDRKATVVQTRDGRIDVHVAGKTYTDTPQPGWADRKHSNNHDCPKMRVRLSREYRLSEERPSHLQVCKLNNIVSENISNNAANVDKREEVLIDPHLVSGLEHFWNVSFDTVEQKEDEQELSIFIEELEYRRTATYPNEPVTLKQLEQPEYDLFQESGPRFSCKIVLREKKPNEKEK